MESSPYHHPQPTTPLSKRGVGRPITPSLAGTQEYDPSIEDKRGKARERQRRKRMRDKAAAAASGTMMEGIETASASSSGLNPPPPLQPSISPHYPPPPQGQTFVPIVPNTGPPLHLQGLPPPPLNAQPPPPLMRDPLGSSDPPKPMSEDEAKKEKIRKAARERQRKHRAILKAKRMSQLDDGPSGIPPGIPHMWPPPGPHPFGDPMAPFDPAMAAMSMVEMDPHSMPFPPPPPNATPGQSFANTLLLALSCSPVLKGHVMRTLHVSNPDFASLEQVIAEAWDRWDHQVSDFKHFWYCKTTHSPLFSVGFHNIYKSVLPQTRATTFPKPSLPTKQTMRHPMTPPLDPQNLTIYSIHKLYSTPPPPILVMLHPSDHPT